MPDYFNVSVPCSSRTETAAARSEMAANPFPYCRLLDLMRTNAYSDITETRNIIEKRDIDEGDIIEKVKKKMTLAALRSIKHRASSTEDFSGNSTCGVNL